MKRNDSVPGPKLHNAHSLENDAHHRCVTAGSWLNKMYLYFETTQEISNSFAAFLANLHKHLSCTYMGLILCSADLTPLH